MTDATESGPPAHRLLATYEQLLACSSRMLALVRERDWESLISEETDYLGVVASLAELEQGLVLSPGEQDRKAMMLERILAQDAEIRRRLIARREELSELIGVSRRRRDLSRSYGPVDLVHSHERLDKGHS